ncbi:VOC family protein [Ornithinibacillus scapharcae]|uniref:VOC family protein n=1 Tax=Ornithinibacillus scapharcae TaxID=1147159 RepID=UPI000225AACF|nr:VOC family protein [Ornithinibacillus scapharcae]
MEIQKVGQIGIPVKDIGRAINFYQEKLDLPLMFNTDSMAFFDLNGLRLMLTLPENNQFDHPSSVLYFQVGDIKETYQEMLEKEVIFLDEPHVVTKIGHTETWMVFFRDSEENVHALMSEVEVG